MGKEFKQICSGVLALSLLVYNGSISRAESKLPVEQYRYNEQEEIETMKKIEEKESFPDRVESVSKIEGDQEEGTLEEYENPQNSSQITGNSIKNPETLDKESVVEEILNDEKKIEGWQTDSEGNRYYYIENEKVYGEKKIEGKWYYFDEINGRMTVGFVVFPKKTVYYDENGQMVYGKQEIDGIPYEFDLVTGKMRLGWAETEKGKVYYLLDGGVVAKGEKKIEGKCYYFDDKTGVMLTGWKEFENPNRKVYYDENGVMVYGEKKIEGKWYYFHKTNGSMQTGFIELPKKTVYYDRNGQMIYGKCEIGGIIYEFDSITGKLKSGWTSSENGKVYVLENGELSRGEKKIEGKWYYFDEETGVMITGWHYLSKANRKVYYDIDGKMVYGEKLIEGYTYCFHKTNGGMQIGFVELPEKRIYCDEDGHVVYGEQLIEGKEYYFDTVTGEQYVGLFQTEEGTKCYIKSGGYGYGEQKVGKEWYYFNDVTGLMETGWKKLSKKNVYYKTTGEMVHGEYKINGKWYYFDKITGAMTTGIVELPKKTVAYGEDGVMLYGEQKIKGHYYYFNKTTGAMLKDGWANGKYYDTDGIQRNRVYQNPSQYYQIKNSITLKGGGYNLSYGYEGVKVMKVIKKLGLGSGVGMNGAFYSRNVERAVKNFQKKNGLQQTGVVDIITWQKMGYTKTQWEQWGAYVSPLKVKVNSTRSEHIEAMISTAYSYLGTPYVIGASGPPGTGIDCSGLVMQALYAAGIDTSPINPVRHAKPGYEYESRNMWKSSQFKHVPYSQRQRGDLIFYQSSSGVVIHVAIYLGDNKVIEAWPNKVVVWPIKNGSRSNIKGVVRPFV